MQGGNFFEASSYKTKISSKRFRVLTTIKGAYYEGSSITSLLFAYSIIIYLIFMLDNFVGYGTMNLGNGLTP